MKLTILALVILILVSCADRIKINSPGNTRVVLARENEKNCIIKSKKRQYGFLYNSFPINSVSFEEEMKEEGKVFGIYERPSWYDIIISIPIIYLTTISVRTYALESCEIKVQIITGDEKSATADELKKGQKKEEENVQKILSELDEKMKLGISIKEDFFVEMKNGEKLKGKLISTDDKKIILEIPMNTTYKKTISVDNIKRIIPITSN